jgi:glucose-6-phosphate isomerase
MDLNKTKAYNILSGLSSKTINLKSILNFERINKYTIYNYPLGFCFAPTLIDDSILDALNHLSIEQNVISKYLALLDGDVVNVSEKRKVLHHQTRSKNNRGFYGQQQERVKQFSEQIHTGSITGFSGKKFKKIIQIGIGGSDLGPRTLYIALERFVKEKKGALPLEAFFISNVDPDEANSIFEKIDFETTLFIVVSKSGTTQETLTNVELLKQKAIKVGINKDAFKKHFITVTGKNSPMDNPGKYLESFYIDDDIGGRYSSTSAVGGTILSLAFGADIFEELLNGAYLLDESAKNPNIFQNMSLLAALIGVWERNFLGFSNKSIIPYSEALSRFCAHLQQLDGESNGKSVNIDFAPIEYQTSPVIFGEPGTNSQHSFFQKLHQGSDVIPIQFIGFKNAQTSFDIEYNGSTCQEKLNANLVAQIVAFATGKEDDNANKNFQGNRPVSLVFADRLTPEVLGALLAFYENLVMFQGFLWNVNSFDQEGVQLGKVLTKEVLSKNVENPNLKGFLDLLNNGVTK